MSSLIATDDSHESPSVEQVDPQLLLKIQKLTAGSPCSARETPKLFPPLAFGYAVVFLTACWLYWSEKEHRSQIERKLAESEKQIEQLAALQPSDSLKNELAELRQRSWDKFLYPALVGATTYGKSADDLFQFEGAEELLKDLLPAQPLENEYEQLALARAFAICGEKGQSRAAFDKAATMTKEPRLQKIIQAEKLILDGSTDLAAPLVTEVLTEVNGVLGPKLVNENDRLHRMGLTETNYWMRLDSLTQEAAQRLIDSGVDRSKLPCSVASVAPSCVEAAPVQNVDPVHPADPAPMRPAPPPPKQGALENGNPIR